MRKMTVMFCWSFCLTLAVATTQAADAPQNEAPKVTYDDNVKPVFRQKCFSCHNSDKKSADLDLTNYTNLMQGGGSGTVVEPGESSSSYLLQLIAHEEEPYMPPESPRIADEMIEIVRKWIDGGLLENQGSQSLSSPKKKVDFALQDTPTERPAEPPLPGRMSLQPITHTTANTAITALATNPWSPVVAVAGQQQVLLYDAQSLQLLGVLAFPEGVAEVLRFSRNGSLLLAGGGRGAVSGRVVVWDVKSGERLFEVGDELDTVLAADISSDQTLIALGGPQKVVRVYSTETGQLLHELRKHTDWIDSLEFSPDGVLLATGDRAGNLFVWEAWTGREYLTLAGHTAAITSVSWRSDSNILATASEDATIRLWEMENGNELTKWNAHAGGVLSIEFVRDGRIVSCGRDRTTKVFGQDGKQQVAFEAFSDLALSATFCDETNRVIAGSWQGEIRVWNVADGSQAAVLTANPPTLQQRLTEATQLLSTRRTELEQHTTAHQAAQSELDKLQSNVALTEQKLKTLHDQLDKLKARVQPATEAVTTVRQSIEAGNVTLRAAQTEVDRWNNQITYELSLEGSSPQ